MQGTEKHTEIGLVTLFVHVAQIIHRRAILHEVSTMRYLDLLLLLTIMASKSPRSFNSASISLIIGDKY